MSIIHSMDKYLERAVARNISAWSPKDQGDDRDLFFIRYSNNTHINTETLKEFSNEKWCVNRLTRNKSFSFEWVNALPNLKWNWDQLSYKNPGIDFVLKHLSKPWNWPVLSLSHGITFTEMVQTKHLPWVIEDVLFTEIDQIEHIEYLRCFRDRYDFNSWVDHSSRVRWNLVKGSPDLPWVYFSVKPEMDTQEDIQFIMDNDPAVWNWGYLSSNTPINLILQNRDLPWNWCIVSSSENVTWHIVTDNPDVPWDYTLVPPEVFDDIFARRWIAASHIKRMFRKSISDPSYKMCRNRLNREFADLEK